MRGYTTQEKLYSWLFGDGIPVTKLIILSNVATYLAIELFHVSSISSYLAFLSSSVVATPWTVFTYPLIGLCGGVICLLFTGYWLWVAGGSLERSWGSRRFAAYFFAMSATSALGLWVGGMLSGVEVPAGGLWLPIAGVTVAWAAMNPDEVILFMLFIPLKLKWVAAIGGAIVLIEYGQITLPVGILALAGCAVSLWYVRSGAYHTLWVPRRGRTDNVVRVRPRTERGFTLNPIRWYQNYRQRKRIKDLFDRSGLND